MPKHTSRKELLKKLKQLGFDGPYAGGRHAFMVRDGLRVRVPNPHGKDVSAALLSEIIRQAGITKEEWGQAPKK